MRGIKAQRSGLRGRTLLNKGPLPPSLYGAQHAAWGPRQVETNRGFGGTKGQWSSLGRHCAGEWAENMLQDRAGCCPSRL